MGFTVGLSLPPDADMALVDGLCAGMPSCGPGFRALVGGDLSRADKLHLCLTVFGQAEKTLLRGEAQPGDVIFLIGRTGLARARFALLEERGRAALNRVAHPLRGAPAPRPRASRKACACRALRRTGDARKAIPPAGGLGSWIFPTASPAICPG